jgi:cobyrinic acid a,c-diamide synthase
VNELSANAPLRADIKAKIETGLPAYAECGGLMYLCREIRHGETSGEMVGVVPAEAVMQARPQGRGYTRFRNSAEHLWPDCPEERAAHEFHYAKLEELPPGLHYARDVTRGYGVDGRHDGIVRYNLIAGFCHLRATGRDPWVDRFVRFVRGKLAK